MKKLVVMLALASCCLLLTPALASASTPSLRSLAKSVAALQKQVKSLKSQLASAKSVLALAPYVSLAHSAVNGVAGPNIVFQGANVTVRSTSNEGDGSATGNLIVGWDPLPLTPPSILRTGANNLVVGTGNNFTSFGCLLAGAQNTVSGPYATVSGGAANVASNAYTSVAGGVDNTAQSFGASISGGDGITLNSVTFYAWQGGSYHTP